MIVNTNTQNCYIQYYFESIVIIRLITTYYCVNKQTLITALQTCNFYFDNYIFNKIDFFIILYSVILCANILMAQQGEQATARDEPGAWGPAPPAHQYFLPRACVFPLLTRGSNLTQTRGGFY